MRNTIICGDALETLQTLPDSLVDCVVTSPPYWGLRDYGTADWEGGDPECDHLKKGKATWGPSSTGSSTLSGKASNDNHERESFIGGYCKKCGAKRIDKQLGLESTLDEYIQKLTEIFREVRRVLKDEGTLWLNMGDGYASNWPCQRRNVIGSGSLENGKRENRPPRLPLNLKDKDLIGQPWRLAFALQADGWYLRSDIIWAKPNPMPESVTDRPTKSHEYIFLMSKQPRYFYDADAIKEASSGFSKMPDGWDTGEGGHGSFHREGREKGRKTRGHARPHQGFDTKWDAMTKAEQSANGRNKRTVWTVATQPFPGAHFATFPEKLIEPCIKAGCPYGGIVLDPFMGSGTTALVAKKLCRDYLGIELGPEYVDMANRRVKEEMGLFV